VLFRSGIATTALGLALIVRINESYGTIEEDEILEIDNQTNIRELAQLERQQERAS